MSGEIASLPDTAELHFSNERAFIRKEAGEGTILEWVDTVYLSRFECYCDDNGRAYVLDTETDATSWHDQMMKTSQTRTLTLASFGAAGPRDVGVCLYRYDAPRAAGRLFWTLRDLQVGLDLAVNSKYAMQWVHHQWSTWQAFILEDLKFPSGHMIRSHASLERQRTRGASEMCDDHSTQEYATSTAATLALLCRWSCTLQGEGRASALKLLSSLLECCVPASSLHAFIRSETDTIDSSSMWPTEHNKHKHVLKVNGRCVLVDAVLAAVPDLRSALKRSLGNVRNHASSMTSVMFDIIRLMILCMSVH